MTAALSTASNGGRGEASFYAAQANREQGAADNATLDNVRRKHLQAANAWTVLADRASAHLVARDARERTTYLLDALSQQNENPDRIEA